MRQRTLLILGAGSSKDFSFPLGAELTAEIANALRFDPSRFELQGGNDKIRALLNRARIHQPQLFDAYLKAADHICRSIHLSSSIDRFLESNRDKPYVAELAKLAILEIIAEYEYRSPLQVNDFQLPSFDTLRVAGTWPAKLFGYIHTNTAEKELEAVFRDLRVVTFNYDRTFEQFIRIAVSNFYQTPLERADSLLRNIHITHVYGSAGSLTRGNNHQPFASCDCDLDVAANRIQTFHESVGSETIEHIKDAVLWCQRVYILGFSFGEMNMNLLQKCGLERGIRPVFATNYKLSEFNTDVARGQLEQIFCQGYGSARLFPVDCARFFDEIQLSI